MVVNQCKANGCYRKLDSDADLCPGCALKKRRSRKPVTESSGKQAQLGLTTWGRWCRQGCCDLDNPEHGSCRI